MNKKSLGLIVVMVLIVGSIAYLENMKAHPVTSGNGAPQTIGVLASNAPSSTGANPNASSTMTLQAVASADIRAGDRPAIEIVDPTGFINASSNFKLADLIG